MTGRAAVAVERLTKRYGAETAASEVSLAVAQGEFVTLLGPSGCGKTTTLRCIAGLERPDAGAIRIEGRTVASAAEGIHLPPEARNIGMVFQSYAVWPHMTVFDNVAYGLRIRKQARGELKRRTMEALELTGLAHLADRYATRLSGGQRQRVALARAIAYRPNVVLYDEPLSNLDAKLREQMRVELGRLQRDVGLTSIYVTHDQAEALALSDRVVVMNEGVIQQVGAPGEVYWRPVNAFVARFIGVANLLDATVRSRDGALCELEVGGEAGRLRLHAASANGVQPGARVRLCVRPEDLVLHLEPPPADVPNLLAGEVADTVYLGSHLECRVVVAGEELCLQTDHAGTVSRGQRVHVSFRPEHGLCLTR